MPAQNSIFSISTSGLDRFLILNQTGTGNATSLSEPPLFLYQSIQEDIDNGAGFVTGHGIFHRYGGSNSKGGHMAFFAHARLTAATNSANPNRNNVGVTGIADATASDGGTNPATKETSKGALFGMGAVGGLSSGATGFLNVTSFEGNTAMKAGSSAWMKSVIQLVGRVDDAVQGSGVDAKLLFFNQTGAVKFNDGILFYSDDVHEFSLNSTATIFRTVGGSVAKGVDLTTTNFTGPAYSSPGFAVGNKGNLVVGGAVGSGDSTIEFGQGRSADGHAYLDFHSAAGQDFNARFIRYAGLNGGAAFLNTGTGALAFNNINNADIQFLTANAMRLEVTNAGLKVFGASLDSGYVFQMPNNSSQKAKAYAWDTYSDARVKTDFSEVKDGLKIALALKPQRYTHLSEGGGKTATIGFVAQEVAEVLPEAVSPGDEESLWSYTPASLMPVAIAAIQELNGRLERAGL